MQNPRTIHRTCVCLVAVLAMMGCAGAGGAQEPGKPEAAAEMTLPMQRFMADGRNASLTILPVRVGTASLPQVGEVVGLLLERAGMKSVEIGTETLDSPIDADMAQTAKAFGEFAKAHPAQTNYVMYADFRVSPKNKFVEVRSLIADKKGELVWQDRQGVNDSDFKRINPREPMQCCILVVERLRPVLKLDDPTREGATEGKLSQRWEKKTGLPDKAEVAAMDKRLQEFKKIAANSTVLIYPVRAGEELSKESAANLANLINKAKLLKATAADAGPRIMVERHMNEQKTLWSMARAFRDHIKSQPPDADYVLFADYLMGKNAVGAAHFALCDRNGEWVIVDFQNSHWDDFNSIRPKSREDCDRLILKRLEGYSK